MSELTITGSVTRTELSLADLALNDDAYKIMRDGYGPGAVTWRRQTVGSPFLPGRYLVNAQKDQGIATLGIRVTGTSKADCLTKTATLVAAFEQFSYNLSMTIEGQTYTWECEPADYAIGASGQIQNFHLMSYKQEVTFEIPRFPVPTVGAF